MLAACTALLLGYWALMTFVPVPGVGQGHFEEGANLANYIDREYLPFRKYDGDHDPEGLLSTLPAIATCLLGVFAGKLLKNREIPDQRKVARLAVAGGAGLALGFLWGMQFPVIKKIWTSSYVLVAAGYSCLLLAAFHQVIQVWGIRRWAAPFVWIGRNPITVYLLYPILAMLFWFAGPSGRGGESILGRYAELGMSTALVGAILLVAYFLDRRRIYLRL
jgi:predicted acyltransferase